MKSLRGHILNLFKSKFVYQNFYPMRTQEGDERGGDWVEGYLHKFNI